MEEKTAIIVVASIVIIAVIIGGILYSSAPYANSESKEYIQNVNIDNNISPSPSWKTIDEERNIYDTNYATIEVIWRAYIGYFQEYGGDEIVVIFTTNISANDYLVGYGDSKPTFTIALETVENVSNFVNNGFGFQDIEKIGPLTYGTRAYTPNIIANWAYSEAYIKEVHNATISAMISPPPESGENISLLYTFTAYIENNDTIHTVDFSFPVSIHYT